MSRISDRQRRTGRAAETEKDWSKPGRVSLTEWGEEWDFSAPDPVASASARNVAALSGEQLRETAAIEGVRQREREGQTFLVLCGPVGVGKTFAAQLALKLAAEKGRTGHWARAVELTRLSLFDAADRARVEEMRTAAFLVIDDLGVETIHDPWVQTLDDVIDARYAARLPTVITTNLDPGRLKERYGARIADRIRHDGLVMSCGTESLRRQAPAAAATAGGSTT